MDKPLKAKILWLIKKDVRRKEIVGFMRDHSEGCLIINGPTGSYYTGHNENWQTKWEEFISAGYLDVDSAIKNKILPSNWKSPYIHPKDQKIINMIVQKKL